MANEEKTTTTVTEFHVPIEDTYMNVIRFGRGEKQLLVLSGMSLCGLEGMGSALENLYKSFIDDYTIYVFDRRKVLPTGFQVRDMAQDIYNVCQGQAVDKAYIVGASQGGMMAQWLAVDHPDFVEKMIVVSSQCKATDKMITFGEESSKFADAEDIVGVNRYFFNMVYSPAYLEAYKEALPTLEKQGSPADCVRYKILANACKEFDVSGHMDKITCPVLVVGDTNDKVIGVEGSNEIAQALNCEKYIYDQYSHAVYDEAPDFLDKVRDFLEK